MPLARICLPRSHDSGASQLGDVIVKNEVEWANSEKTDWSALEKEENDVKTLIGNAFDQPLLKPLKSKVLEMVNVSVAALLKRFSVTTDFAVVKQLLVGVRSLDFRIFKQDDEYYFYHGLLGPEISVLIKDVTEFLGNHSGEIVYISCSHFDDNEESAKKPFERWGAEFLDFAYGQFSENKTWNLYQPVYANGQIVNENPFAATYDTLTDKGTKSCLILATKYDTDAEGWWSKPYCYGNSPKSRNAKIVGNYSNTSSYEEVAKNQAENYKTAKDLIVTGGKPDLAFGLDLILTPEFSTVLGDYRYEVANSLREFADTPVVKKIPGARNAVDDVADKIQPVKNVPTYTSLEQLSETLNVRATAQQIQPLTYTAPNYISMLSFDMFTFNERAAWLAVEYSLQEAVESNHQAVYSFYAKNDVGPSYRYLYRSLPEPFLGWHFKAQLCYALDKTAGSFLGAVPIYRHRQIAPGREGFMYRLSIFKETDVLWVNDGIVTYALRADYPGEETATLPVIEYSMKFPRGNAETGDSYYYSLLDTPVIDHGNGKWTRVGPVFRVPDSKANRALMKST